MKKPNDSDKELNRDIKRTIIFCKAMTNLAEDFHNVGLPEDAKLHLFSMRDFINKTLPEEPSPKNSKQEPYKRGNLKREIYKLFRKKGVDKVTYDETFTLAKRVKPDTKFNHNNFAWYKNDFRKKFNDPHKHKD